MLFVIIFFNTYSRYIANLAVNGHPASLGASPTLVRTIDNRDIPAPSAKEIRSILDKKKNGHTSPKWRQILREQGPKALAWAVRKHQNILVTDTTWRGELLVDIVDCDVFCLCCFMLLFLLACAHRCTPESSCHKDEDC